MKDVDSGEKLFPAIFDQNLNIFSPLSVFPIL